MATRMREEGASKESWGELRALMHDSARAPAFDEVWRILHALEDHHQRAAIDYTRHHIEAIAPDLTAHLEVFEEELLCDWSIHLVWWRLLGWSAWFDDDEDLRALLLADVALLEHVASGFVSHEALALRRGELEVDLPYRELDGEGMWVQQFVYAALEPDTMARVRALHDVCASWEVLPNAKQSIREEFGRGLARLREGGSLPSLLGGGRGITQFFGAGEGFVRGVTESLKQVQQDVEDEGKKVRSRLELWFAAYALDWLEGA